VITDPPQLYILQQFRCAVWMCSKPSAANECRFIVQQHFITLDAPRYTARHAALRTFWMYAGQKDKITSKLQAALCCKGVQHSAALLR
jgi:hypothetical protein